VGATLAVASFFWVLIRVGIDVLVLVTVAVRILADVKVKGSVENGVVVSPKTALLIRVTTNKEDSSRDAVRVVTFR